MFWDMSRDLTTQYRAFSLTRPVSLQFIGTKESVYIRKDYNSHKIVSERQHGSCFIVLELQYGWYDAM